MEQKPIVYLFYGDDELAINHAVDALYVQLGDPVTADMNTARFDGTTVTETELLNAAATLPFLAERRLVVVSHPLARLADKNSQKLFCQMLESLPDTTALVLVVQDQKKFKQGEWRWDTLSEKHWLREWCMAHKPRAYLKDFSLPQTGAMPGWIQSRAAEMGGKFDKEAAVELAGLVENNTRIAELEIGKLLTYVNGERPVALEDVQQLTAFKAEASVFELVDAMAERNTRKSLQVLHHLLDEQDEQSIFPMVVRQFRLLVQTRALMDEGQGIEKIQSILKVAPFVAKKLYAQGSHFTLPQLKNEYRELHRIDIAAKSTETSISLALDLFITNLG